MTGLLSDLMHERADALGAPDLDLAEITRAGDRRVRRRRTALATGLAAAAAVAAVAVPSLVLDGDDVRPTRHDPAADGTAGDARGLAWVTGSTLHRSGQPDADLGVDVRAWVWVGDAIVFTDFQRRVRLWDGDTLEDLGPSATTESDSPELVSDGMSVAWVSPGERVMHYDVSERTLVLAPELPGNRPRVTAIDGADVYAADTAGVYAWQPSAPDGFRTLSTDPTDAVMDAESGTLVRGAVGNEAVLTRDGSSIDLSTREFADLSPDGSLVAIEKDDVGQVVDAVTGEARPFDHGHEWAIGYQWLDESTLAVMAFDGIEEDAAASAWLLTCDGRSGACDGPGTAIPAGFGEFQLPIGIAFAE